MEINSQRMDPAKDLAPARFDNTIIKALARAFRWRKLLENGIFASLNEIAQAEKINPSYVSRILRLTLLYPSIIEAILAGRQPPHLQLNHLLSAFPVEWERQGESYLKSA